MSPADRHIARETIVSAAINGVISTGFFLATFGSRAQVPVWGEGNYAFDFVPQSMAVGFMAALVPGLLCRKAIAGARFGSPVPGVSAVGPVVAAALLSGLLSVIVGAALCALVLRLTGLDNLANAPALAFKVLYGSSLGAVVTAITLRRMLR